MVELWWMNLSQCLWCGFNHNVKLWWYDDTSRINLILNRCITLWPLTGVVNNTDYLLASVSGWDWKEFDNGQSVMAIRLGQSISKTANLVAFSWSAVVSVYQNWSYRKEQWWTSNRIMGSQGSLHMHMWSESWPMWSVPTDELKECGLV